MYGGGFYGKAGLISNTTFVSNSAAEEGDAIYWHAFGGFPITNTVVWGHGDNPIVGIGKEPVVSFCNIEGGFVGEGNINVDPGFVDANEGNYRLIKGSLCIDAGANAHIAPDTFDLDHDGDVDEGTPFDLDGNARVVDGNDDGDARVDMGAYEFGHGLCSADVTGDGAVDVDDLLTLLASWGDCDACPADLNGDGIVSTFDIILIFRAWGMC